MGRLGFPERKGWEGPGGVSFVARTRTECSNRGTRNGYSSSGGSSRTLCVLLNFPRAPGSWFLLLFYLLILSKVSEECPNTCQCRWVSGKESVSCFRAGLTKIPSGLDPGTQVLNISGNGLKSLPGFVFLSLSLLNLQKIYLSECELVSLDRNVFSKLTNLVELELSGNRLSSVPSHTFGEIPELRELKINLNPITRLPNHAFFGLRRLVRLELTNCQLATIETWAFRELPALEWLRLDNNRLLTVQAESFFPLQSLHGLKINGNPWNCSCSLKPLRSWMLKNNVPFEGIPPICQTPGRLEGKPWDRLELEDFACLPKLQTLAEEERIRRVVEGHNITFVCRLQATADTHVSWFVGSRTVPLNNGTSWSGGGNVILSESFVWRADFEDAAERPEGEDAGEEDDYDGYDEDEGGLDGVAEESTQKRRKEKKNRERKGSRNGMSSSSSSSSGGGARGAGGSRTRRSEDRSLGLKKSALTIIRTTPRDTSVYTCRGESRAGSVAANFSLVVLQNKAENLTGRLLFTGTLVAALLTLVVCLLLSCVCLVGRHRQSTVVLVNHHDKIELNHVSSAGNNAVVGQNGGTGLLAPNHHPHHHLHHNSSPTSTSTAAGGTTTTTASNHLSNNLSSNNILRRPAERSQRDYKALPTTDPEETDKDLDSWDAPSRPITSATTTTRSGQSSGTGANNVISSSSSTAKYKYFSSRAADDKEDDELEDDEDQEDPSSSRRRRAGAAGNNNNNNILSPSSPPTGSGGGGGGYSSAGVVVGSRRREGAASSSAAIVPAGAGAPGARDKFPDLIDEKMSSMASSIPGDFVSLPRLNRNSDYHRPSSFHRRMNSGSQSPLLSAYHSSSSTTYGGNSADTRSIASSESLAYSSNLVLHQDHYHHHHQQQQQHHHHPPPPPLLPLSSHHHHHHHYQQQQQQQQQQQPRHHHYQKQLWESHGSLSGMGAGGSSTTSSQTTLVKYTKGSASADRLSMPTSPLHDPHSTTYDYHAAQLAAFLEEYRLLQLELMRMSASLNNSTTSPEGSNANNLPGAGAIPSSTAPSSSTSNPVLLSSLSSPPPPSKTHSSPGNPLLPSQQQQSSHPAPSSLSSSNPNFKPDNVNPHQSQQLKSILKNSSHNPNNNYMA